MRLSERTVLSCLRIQAWGGNATDREVTEEVSENHAADLVGAGRYSKRLVSRTFLREVNSKISTARRVHKLLTLPWDDDSRILSTNGYMHYTEQMRLSRLSFEAAVGSFASNFNACVQEARSRLGTMFDESEYPAAEEVRQRYSLQVEIKPVPEAGDFRAELSNQSTAAIVKDIERRQDQRLEQAMDDVFKRIETCTSHMVDRLRAYKPVDGARAENGFKDSLVWNLKGLADLIPSLNITQDKRLTQLHQQILDQLVENSPDILRDNERVRHQTAERAEKILNKVRNYLA